MGLGLTDVALSLAGSSDVGGDVALPALRTQRGSLLGLVVADAALLTVIVHILEAGAALHWKKKPHESIVRIECKSS